MRRVVAAAAATAVALAAVVLVAGPASAHNRVIASTPAAGSTLTALPARFSITTDEPLLVVGGSTRSFALDVADARGRHYGDGCITVVDNVMSTAASIGAAGAYTVRYQLVSADGHTVSDTFSFTWAPSGTSTPARGHATAERCGATAASGETAGPSAGGSGRGAPVPLGDVLWIGGAILVLLVAGGVVLLVLTRRSHPIRGSGSDRARPGRARRRGSPARPRPDARRRRGSRG